MDVGPFLESLEAMSALRSAVADALKDGSEASRDVRVSLEANLKDIHEY